LKVALCSSLKIDHFCVKLPPRISDLSRAFEFATVMPSTTLVDTGIGGVGAMP
jgi:hypothetical protein